MRIVFFVSFFFLLLSAGCATGTLATEEEMRVEQVYDVPNLKKDAVHNQIKIWIAENFKSAKQVIEHDDKESGTLIGNGTLPYPEGGSNAKKLNFTMRADAKDNKFKLNFINLVLSWQAYHDAFWGVHYPAGEKIVDTKEEMERIRPMLLKFGPDIQQSITKDKSKENW